MPACLKDGRMLGNLVNASIWGMAVALAKSGEMVLSEIGAAWLLKAVGRFQRDYVI
jgi:hypothetical protein